MSVDRSAALRPWIYSGASPNRSRALYFCDLFFFSGACARPPPPSTFFFFQGQVRLLIHSARAKLRTALFHAISLVAACSRRSVAVVARSVPVSLGATARLVAVPSLSQPYQPIPASEQGFCEWVTVFISYFADASNGNDKTAKV